MQAAIVEVQGLPHYESNGEVSGFLCTCIILPNSFMSVLQLLLCSGSLLMQGMTPLQMPTTPQSYAYLEGAVLPQQTN